MVCKAETEKLYCFNWQGSAGSFTTNALCIGYERHSCAYTFNNGLVNHEIIKESFFSFSRYMNDGQSETGNCQIIPPIELNPLLGNDKN